MHEIVRDINVIVKQMTASLQSEQGLRLNRYIGDEFMAAFSQQSELKRYEHAVDSIRIGISQRIGFEENTSPHLQTNMSVYDTLPTSTVHTEYEIGVCRHLVFNNDLGFT